MAKTLAQYKAEYEAKLREVFAKRLEEPEGIRKSVERVVLDGVGALLGLRWDSFQNTWQPPTYRQDRPFDALMLRVLTEVVEEHRETLKAAVAEIVAGKTFLKEVQKNYKYAVEKAVEGLLDDEAKKQALAETGRILAEMEGR